MKPEVTRTDHFDSDFVSYLHSSIKYWRWLPVCKSLLNAFHTILSFLYTNIWFLAKRHITKEYILFIHKVTGAVLRTHIFVFWYDSPPQWPGPLHSRGFWITHNDAPHSVGFLWTSDQLVAEICQHTTLTTDKRPCPRWDSYPPSHQACGCWHTP